MSPKTKTERLLDGLLAVPGWYAAILLAQLSARKILPLLKQTYERSDKALQEWVKGHTLEEGPELLRGFRELRVHLLEVELGNELVRVADRLPTRVLIQSCFFLSRQCDSYLKSFRRATKSAGPEPGKTSPAVQAKSTPRPTPRPPRRPSQRLPRSSAQRSGSRARVQRLRPSGPRKRTTKQSQEPPHEVCLY